MTLKISAAVAALALGMAVAGAAEARTACTCAAKTAQPRAAKHTSTTTHGVEVIRPEVVTYYSEQPAAPAPTSRPAFTQSDYPPPEAEYAEYSDYGDYYYPSVWGYGYGLPFGFGGFDHGFRRNGFVDHHDGGVLSNRSHGGRVVPTSRFLPHNNFMPRPAFASETFNSRGFRRGTFGGFRSGGFHGGGFHGGGLVARGAIGGGSHGGGMGGRGR
jgi:hypothetical protein